MNKHVAVSSHKTQSMCFGQQGFRTTAQWLFQALIVKTTLVSLQSLLAIHSSLFLDWPKIQKIFPAVFVMSRWTVCPSCCLFQWIFFNPQPSYYNCSILHLILIEIASVWKLIRWKSSRLWMLMQLLIPLSNNLSLSFPLLPFLCPPGSDLSENQQTRHVRLNRHRALCST